METLIVANKLSNTVSIIDTVSFRTIKEISVEDKPYEVVTSPDNKFALVSNFGDEKGKKPGNTLLVIDLFAEIVCGTIVLPVGSRPHGIKFVSDIIALVTVEGIQSLLSVNIVYLTACRITVLPGKGARSVTVNASKKFAYVGNIESGSICKVDMDTFTVVKEVKIGSSVECVILTPDDTTILVANGKDSSVSIINASNMMVTKVIKTDRKPVRLAMFNDGKSCAILNNGAGTVQIIDMNSMQITNTFVTTKIKSTRYGHFRGAVLSMPTNIIIRCDQVTAYISNFNAGNITLVNLMTGEIVRTFEASDGPDGSDIYFSKKLNF